MKKIIFGIIVVCLVIGVVTVAVKIQNESKLKIETVVQETTKEETSEEATPETTIEETAEEVTQETTTEETSEEATQETTIEEMTEEETTTQEMTEAAEQITRPQNSMGTVICIDPGHQRRGNSEKEPNGPGSSTMKAKVTGGTTGAYTNVAEYELTLTIGLKLKEELQNRGYTVVMTRESHDVNLSNKERADIATEAGADLTIRIHADGVDNASVSGASVLSPTTSNPYIAEYADESWHLSECLIQSYCAATGMRNRGVSGNDTMTGMNWSTNPVALIELGFMTNETDDYNMQDSGYQTQMVYGIANGIDAYMGK